MTNGPKLTVHIDQLVKARWACDRAFANRFGPKVLDGHVFSKQQKGGNGSKLGRTPTA